MRDAEELAKLLKVLSVETRVRIVQLLKGRALCVNALAARLNVTQGAVSQHLRFMRDAGLVIDDRRGTFVHYRLDEKTLAAWRAAIDRLLDPGQGGCAAVRQTTRCAAARGRKSAGSRRT